MALLRCQLCVRLLQFLLFYCRFSGVHTCSFLPPGVLWMPAFNRLLCFGYSVICCVFLTSFFGFGIVSAAPCCPRVQDTVATCYCLCTRPPRPRMTLLTGFVNLDFGLHVVWTSTVIAGLFTFVVTGATTLVVDIFSLPSTVQLAMARSSLPHQRHGVAVRSTVNVAVHSLTSLRHHQPTYLLVSLHLVPSISVR